MRIFSETGDINPEIDKSAVLDFFEKRAEKVKDIGAVRAVIYQDKNPDLAERRDRAEKLLFYPLIDLNKDSRVLDAGCGTGRWAEAMVSACGSYHGVDVSPGLIQVAQELYGHHSNVKFSVCSLDKLSMKNIGETIPFDRILSLGVYIYLNDTEVFSALNRLAELSSRKTKILIREPIAVHKRLTLKRHFSEDMEQEYNAIYRTEKELLDMFQSSLEANGFRLEKSGDVYTDNSLNNRTETKQKFFLWVR